MLMTFWLLLVGHALADYAWQSKGMARRKIPRSPPLREAATYGPWWWHMTAHAGINGGMVTLVTGSLLLGLSEALLHWCLDTAKATRMISRNTDQLGHLACKALWAVLVHA